MGWWLNWRLRRLRRARDARVARLKLAQLGGDQKVISRHREALARYKLRIAMLTGEPEPGRRGRSQVSGN